MAMISTRALEKTFAARRRGRELFMPWRQRRKTTALAGVDLDVEAGELVAILGPNGAGKTTLLKILATLIRPSAGSATVGGADVVKRPDAARARLGYVLTEERSFFWRLSVRDNLRFFCALQGLYGRARRERIDELAALLALGTELDRDFMDLSAGQKQRVAIARGLISDPPVLLFDEATRSLDPGRAERVRRVIREILVEKQRKAVLFATHDLAEARALSDRTVVMKEGKIACQGRFADVEAETLAIFREEARAEDAAYESIFQRETA
jgi:ABC-2 type transport system ATP-binding protein